MSNRLFRCMAVAALIAVSGCAVPQPEMAAKPVRESIDSGASEIVVSANPQASAAGLAILRAGGTAVDAAIAMQAVLGLVEPQGSGLLGGSVTLVWDPKTSEITTYDGMATAPAAATKAVTLGRSGNLLDPRELPFSPRAVGVPGVIPALYVAHRAQGKLSWEALFEPAIALAEHGAAMPKQLHDLLSEPGADTAYADLRAPYLNADGKLIDIGQSFRNPAYAAVLKRVAKLGPAGLYAEGGMEAVLSALHHGQHPSLIVEADLRNVTPRVTKALCAPWQDLRICTAPAPAMGGVVMLQILGMVKSGDPTDASFVHRFLEASRLAEADRRRYLADPNFADVPVEGLLDPAYLQSRAALIQPGSTIDRPRPGELEDEESMLADPNTPMSATSEIAVVDADGRAVSMTSTLNFHFGARIAAEGMVFNNALLNFAPPPPTSLPGNGGHYANEMAPGKRPLSPIAPVIVLGADNKPLLVGGGAGGPVIPDTLAMTLIDILARHASLQQALSDGHFTAADPDHIVLETGTPATSLRPALEAIGHRVELETVDTGTAILLHGADGWSGLADPRRDGGPAQGAK